MSFFCVVFLLLFSHSGAQNIGFISPKYQPTSIGGSYGATSQWPLGSSQIVAFSCPWESYRLELWQQSLVGAGATSSTNFVYNQSAGQHLDQSFYWTVQTYEFQLSNSPVFFWWLFDNNSSSQQSSAYFNITIDAASSSSSSTSPSATPTPTLSSTPSTPPSTQATSSTDSSTASSTSASVQPALGSSSPAAASKNLSTGAAAGVGVGVALGVILIAAAGALLFWKRKRRQNNPRLQPELQGSGPMDNVNGSPAAGVPTSLYVPKPGEAPPYYYPQPVELN
ncbi:hypothetical protein GGS24DRAFT_331133 [Hypoxylon argillaceum]|nr:hypothetical protein GGS24DRAFT_331133 [Hypoxylon argillaceum]KAI1153964.1 hypothetical protein F4825DRAFT_228557 [Nemania diffusa]